MLSLAHVSATPDPTGPPARDSHELRRVCATVLEQAARARLELHRMYGQQADAFTFTLPLARGLR
ncbi:MAG: hypothetical protein ACLP0J_00160 [Solirubrobacteraceae bacterium]